MAEDKSNMQVHDRAKLILIESNYNSLITSGYRSREELIEYLLMNSPESVVQNVENNILPKARELWKE